MLRALYAGVSGLRNHLVRLDVIGNNIANVNTVAFKGSRVTFEEAFAQLVQGASRPPGDLGGINPIQVGLGMNIGSIDQNFAQGNLESTGVTTDLAIQGDGFFVASDGQRVFYTRAGNFQLEAEGRLVSPTNGFVVQGIVADSTGNLTSGSAITDVVLPFGQKSPANASTEMQLTGNLDARAQPLGTILRNDGALYAIEQSTSNGGLGSDINGLYASGAADSRILGMTNNSTTVTVDDGTTSVTYTYVTQDTGVGDQAFNSLNDLVAEINNDYATITAAVVDTTGAIQFTAGGAPVTINMSSSNTAFSAALAAANGTVAAGGTASTDQFSHVAGATDLLTNLRNEAGTSLGLAVGQSILIDGNVGGTAVTQGTVAVGAGTTYSDLLQEVDDTLGIANITGVASDATTGNMQITGDGGLSNALTGINVRVSGGAATFNSVFDSRPGNWVEQQAATDVTHETAISIFDSMGNTHVVSMTFTKDPTQSNRWLWAAGVPSPAIITGGGTGAITFDSTGNLETFTYDGGAASLQINPNTGASSGLDITLDAGTLGDIDGISQFASSSNAVASAQDGYGMGDLQDIQIDNLGVITGFFSNGVTQVLAQVALAAFNNPGGLLRRGDNMYEESANSGPAVIGFAGSSNQSTITPGALESSNVDLSQEFTNMITAQRGFQANARVITTADEMMSELVNLKR
jgi:flagellar hook protein FlgE